MYMVYYSRIIIIFTACIATFGIGSNIKLLPHQKKVLNHLHTNTNQHGLILYHALGAGKTITSLEYAKEQHLSTIVLAPEVLKAHWLKEIEKVGIPSKKIMILSYNTSEGLEKLKNTNLSKSLLIVDEVQKFIEQVRHSTDKCSLNLYWDLLKSRKILLLTGTPIFNDATDIAYIGNLAFGEEKFPFHPDEFKNKYMSIDTTTSLFRGYLTESKLMSTALPLYASFIGASLIAVSGTFWALPVMSMVGSSALNFINEQNPVNHVSFRKFDAAEFSEFSNRYISYYKKTPKDSSDYPSTSVHPMKVSYTNSQVSFFMDFLDGVLTKENLNLLLKDYPNTYSPAMLHINSSKIQQDLLAQPGAGREIGNLSLRGTQKLEEPIKFLKIKDLIHENPGKTVIYSSYYHNGILKFADFLKKNNINYEILEAKSSTQDVRTTLDHFNSGKNKVLLLHPEITEGVSLIGVEQLHILEPVKNAALEKQIIGRSARYQSHKHLPKHRQTVDIFLWESTVEYSHLGLPTEAGLVRRDHWRKRHREINPNLWTNGITQLDSQYFKKDQTPDQRTNIDKNFIVADMNSFQNICEGHSLENYSNNKVSQYNLATQLHSPFASPLLYLNYTNYQSHHLKTFQKGTKIGEITNKKSASFDIEIPHTNEMNIGFGLRHTTGLLQPKILTISNIPYSILEMDLALLSRIHYEHDRLPEVSFYWKNEIDLSVSFMQLTNGLGIGLRQSLGAQMFISKHIGINIECGLEGKAIKDTMTSHHDNNEMFESQEIQHSVSHLNHPFVNIGVFSTYF
ncbi:MAG: helicase-related protein [Oligoflexales bacterium]